MFNVVASTRGQPLALAALAALLLSSSLPAANWPQWRGPNFNGSTAETNLPRRLSKQEQVLWKTPLPGRSGATPVVWGDAVFLPSPDAQKRLLLFCLDRATGKVRWQRTVAEGDRVVGKNNMASPSAITDGRRVYALFGTSDFAAFDFQGNELWRRALKLEFGAFANMFLYGASPLLFEDKLYVPLLQRNPPTYGHAADSKPERKSWLICVDPRTGKTLWAHERITDALEEAMEAYTTPLPFAAPGGPQILLVGADALTAHLPGTGEELWRYPGLNRKKNTGGRIVPSPVADAGLVFVCGPKREMLAAIRPGAGLLGEDHLAWKTEQYIPDVATPLCCQGKLFVLDGDRQVMVCYEPQTGRQLWQGRLGIREIFYASPTGADGKIYCLSEEGTLVVLSAGDRFEVLSTTPFGEGPCRSSVVICDGQFFIRTATNLYCLRGGA
jgi:outer membrane protein assembly factor BamB